MLPTRNGAIRLFRIAGIDLFLHWSWFLVAAIEISHRGGEYSTLYWNALEYLALFFIVMLHEFGHSLACRQVGGTANQIVLWPLGGVAYVSPPPRPGAVLWSIAAGPLVNVALVPVLTILGMTSQALGWDQVAPNLHALLWAVWTINVVLLIFNLLPIYPLDGGQILQAVLWFVLGRGRSLMVACGVGLFGVVGLIVLAVWMQSIWLGILAVFIFLGCWGGLRQARALYTLANAPRRNGFACPSCHGVPPRGDFWLCGQCRRPFDTFETQAVCPHCQAGFGVTRCADCGGMHPMSEWILAAMVPPKP